MPSAPQRPAEGPTTSILALDDAAIRRALRAIRSGRRGRHPLIDAAFVGARLRELGHPDTERMRWWMLDQIVGDVIWHRIGELRGGAPRLDRHALRALAPHERLATLFDAACSDHDSPLRPWSALYGRYYLDVPDDTDIGARIGFHRRTFQRWLRTGYDLLRADLHALEVGARTTHAPTPEADAGAARAPSVAVRDGGDRQRRGGSAAGTRAYWQDRIAVWSSPRLDIDTAYVEPALVRLHGDAAIGLPASSAAERYEGLDALLAAVRDAVIVLLGAPGSGKTGALGRYELDTARRALNAETDRVTFYVPLGDYAGGPTGRRPPDPHTWLARRWASRYPAMPPLDDLLSSGRVDLLLDDLQALPHADGREYRAMVDAWRRYAADATASACGNRALFTCRRADYSVPLSTPDLSVPRVYIDALDDRQSRRLLAQIAPQRPTLWDELRERNLLAALRTPRMLRMVAGEALAGGDLSDDPAALVTSYVRRALRRELKAGARVFAPGEVLSTRDCARIANRAWGVSPYDLPDEGPLVRGLSRLALALLNRSPGGSASDAMRHADARRAIDDPAAASIVEAGIALGVLEEDMACDEVGFADPVVRAYFAGRALVAPERKLDLAAPWRAHEVVPPLEETLLALGPAERLPELPRARWTFAAVMGGIVCPDPDAYVSGIARADFALAARCAAHPQVRRRLSGGIVDRVRSVLLARSTDRDADLRIRIEAALALGRLGDPRYERHDGPDGQYLLPPVVAVPAGTYPIGDDRPIEPYGHSYAFHTPAHTVILGAFGMARFPLTNAEWACFVAAGGYRDARWWDTPAALAWSHGESTGHGQRSTMRYYWRALRRDPPILEHTRRAGAIDVAGHRQWLALMELDEDAFEQHLSRHVADGVLDKPAFWQDADYNAPTQPVVGISWHEARAYARWLSAQCGSAVRLPTEVEWEAAARGIEGRSYAYGNALLPLAASSATLHLRRPAPVGVFPTGDTPLGLSDMAGNVAAWTSTAAGTVVERPTFVYPYRADDGREDADAAADLCRVVRGTRFYFLPQLAAFRMWNHPCDRDPGIGLRLVFEI